MSKKQILTLVLAVTALTAQIAFAEGLPANVQNISADLSSGTLTVSWAPVTNAAFYRIYYSHESILGNQGNYDDFERTIARETTHTFTKIPLTSPKIFVSVLAVDAAGNESEGFETEASVDQPQAPVPAPAAPVEPPASVPDQTPTPEPAPEQVPPEAMPQGENPTTTAEPMAVASVVSISSTGVLVTFTKSVREGAAINEAFFMLTDSGGVALRVNHVLVNGQTALLTTDQQVPERDYLFGLLLPIPAGDGTNAVPFSVLMPLRGYGVMQAPVPAPAQPQNQPVPQPQGQDIPYGQNPLLGGQPPPQIQQQGGYGQNPMLANVSDPTFLDLKATPRKDGTYDVIARWNGTPGAQNYGLYTSVDGQPFAWNSQVGSNETTVQYSRVRPGTFALKVTARTPQGQESRGVERALNLPASGIGVIGIMAAAGAAAGARMRRRKKVAV